MEKRIVHDYRQMMGSPTKFLTFNQNVKRCLSDSNRFPEAVWGSNLSLLQKYLVQVDQLEVSYHLASDAGKSLIRERENLSGEILKSLDMIAPIVESMSRENPDLLLYSGFTLSQERRKLNREKLPLAAAADFSVVNLVDSGKVLASASPMPGAYNGEIHVNGKDPSVEQDWSHKAIYADPAKMVIEGLDPGNIFFRMRYHGPDGPGPWSSVVTITVT